MAKITFIEPNGRTIAIEISDGCSLMQAATTHGLAGLYGECGGAGACATCHGYVEGDAVVALAPPDETEAAMLEAVAAEFRPNSRLCCQIKAAAPLDGLTFRIAERQD